MLRAPHTTLARRAVLAAAACALLASLASPPAWSAGNLLAGAHRRVPTALCLTPDVETLFIANSRSGSISIIDTANRRVLDEVSVARSLVGLAALPQTDALVSCDPESHELLIINRTDRQLQVRARVALHATPASLTLSPDGATAYVSSVRNRKVIRIDLAATRVTATLDCDFSPRTMRFLPDGRTLVVADAFGGKLALLDTSTSSDPTTPPPASSPIGQTPAPSAPAGRIVRVLDLPAHNIRGLALSPDGRNLLLTHMRLTDSAATTRANVFWGVTMTSNLRTLPLSALQDPAKDPVAEGSLHFFGDPGHGAGDPEAIATLSDGTVLACLAGVGQVAIGRYQPYDFRRIVVGDRPTAIAVSPDARLAYVANTHSDSISVIDIPRRACVATIPLGPQPSFTPAETGQRLFYDARISLDGWYSCHSCHTDGHTSGGNADTLGDGSYGAPKNIPSLLGAADTDPWAWNGSMHSLEEQVRSSFTHTMQSPSPPTDEHVAALTAYLRTLQPLSQSPRQRAGSTEPVKAAAIQSGRRLFDSLRCTACHRPPTYTTPETYDVGLDDGDGGNKRFNPPSLRGVAHSAPYLHDGRAESLEAVFQKYQHQLTHPLTDQETTDLTTFLRSL